MYKMYSETQEYNSVFRDHASIRVGPGKGRERIGRSRAAGRRRAGRSVPTGKNTVLPESLGPLGPRSITGRTERFRVDSDSAGKVEMVNLELTTGRIRSLQWWCCGGGSLPSYLSFKFLCNFNFELFKFACASDFHPHFNIHLAVRSCVPAYCCIAHRFVCVISDKMSPLRIFLLTYFSTCPQCKVTSSKLS
jgi:hypothetical protein